MSRFPMPAAALKKSDFDFDLPPELIAQAPLAERSASRMLVVPPGAPLVTRGPYQWMRHPNYVAVAGELAGAGVMMAAPFAGVIFTMLFIEIMRRRVRVEERMLGIGRT